MNRCILKLICASAPNAAYFLCANVPFDQTDQMKNALNQDSSVALIKMDRKQKSFPMKFQVGQIENFGKNGRVMLGIMRVQ